MRSAKNVVIFGVGVGWYITQRCYFPPMCANSLPKRRISADFRRLAQILGIYFYMFFCAVSLRGSKYICALYDNSHPIYVVCFSTSMDHSKANYVLTKICERPPHGWD